MNLSRAARTLWAKTPGRETSGMADGQWLSLHQHLRDAADVGMALSERWVAPTIRRQMDSLTGGFADEVIGWLAGTHDLGKAQILFQAQISNAPDHAWMWEQVRTLGIVPALVMDSELERAHSVYSDLILRRGLQTVMPEADMPTLVSITAIAGCHHGQPSPMPDSQDSSAFGYQKAERWLDAHGSEWSSIWSELIDDITQRTGALPGLRELVGSGGIPVQLQLSLSGLVTMADWIASNQYLFPLSATGAHVDESSRAQKALEQLGLTRFWVPSGRIGSVAVRFGWPPDASLRASQSAAVEIAEQLPEGPALVMIEAETGEGKTEAGLLVAELLADRAGAGGVAFALPTMATSDAMFRRVRRWVESLSAEEGELHSLFLGHSRALLNQDYDDLLRSMRSIDEEADGPGGSVVAHQWLRGRRRGLLSEFVVSTVDQVLMMALATRYVTLRHLGLAGKVVVIDEAHAYDVYSSSYLGGALRWLGAHGAPVVILSATLAESQRAELTRAYEEGLTTFRTEAERGPSSSAHAATIPGAAPQLPRLTVVSSAGRRVHALPARSGHREVHLQLIDDGQEAVRRVLDSVRADGGVVGIVCNAVARAQEVYGWACGVVGETRVELLHSQFTAVDRAQREQDLVRSLGPEARRGQGRPHCQVVVGTQVLEQSLDIDLDLLITDLAPTDSLAQRAGRLHRHRRGDQDRPPELRIPRILVCGVDGTGPVPEPHPGSVAVYGTRTLLATMATLEPHWRGRPWCLRHDVGPAVELTYSPRPPVPADWAEVYAAAEAEEQGRHRDAEKRSRDFQLLPPARSRGRLRTALKKMGGMDVERDEVRAQAHVRDIQPTLEVLLVQQTSQGELRPLPWLRTDSGFGGDILLDAMQIPPDDVARVVAASALRLPGALVPPHEFDAALTELERRGMPGWQGHHLLKGQLVLTVDEDLFGSLNGRDFHYDPHVGLVTEPRPDAADTPVSERGAVS